VALFRVVTASVLVVNANDRKKNHKSLPAYVQLREGNITCRRKKTGRKQAPQLHNNATAAAVTVTCSQMILTF